MFVTIMRHGEAGYSAARDAERPLTERGRAQVRRGAQQLLALCKRGQIARPHRLLNSPYRRTTETAAIVGEILGLAPQALEQLAPGHGPADVEDKILSNPADKEEHFLLVSHQPLVSLLVMRWCGSESPRHVLNPGGFTMLSADIILSGMATHQFSALPPDFEVLA